MSVEFALVFPVILGFFFGTVVLIQAYTLRDTAQHAAYEGARKAMVFDATSGDCVDAVEEFLQIMRLEAGDITVTPSTITTATEEVTVRVDIPFANNAFMAGGLIPDDWQTSGQVTLQRGFIDEE